MMELDVIFSQRRKKWNSLIKNRKAASAVTVTCKKCGEQLVETEVAENFWTCPKCGHYFPIPPMERIRMLADENSFREHYGMVQTADPLHFPGYSEKLTSCQEKTGFPDAIVTGTCLIDGCKTAIAVLDPAFLMGSMGTVVGEKIVRLTEHARKRKMPLLIFSASGGARMQEGLFSLMQMARTSAAIQQFKSQGGLFLSVMTNPTTGGVSASFASLGDIMIAEPDALICFAGPRVIEQTIGQTLPPGFQHAEFLLEHGMIDLILERPKQKKVIGQILNMHAGL